MAVSNIDNGLQDQINDLNSKLKDVVIRKQFSIENQTINANTGHEFAIPLTIPSGYKYVCITRGYTGNSYVQSNNQYVGANNNIMMTVRNFSNSQITGLSLFCDVLFIRNL